MTTISSNEDFSASVREGRAGELFFRKVYEDSLKKRGLRLVDVAGDGDWMKYDVDYLILKEDKIYQKIEVKIDKRCDGTSATGSPPTGNLVYEYISHDKNGNQVPGWCEKTKADYAVFILGEHNRKNRTFTVSRLVFVDMFRWRMYTDSHPSKLYEMREQHPLSDTDMVGDYRHKYDELKKEGVIVTENTKVRGEIIKF